MRGERVTLPATLLATMTASAYPIFVVAVLASPLIAEFGMTRTELGLVGSANTLVGAATAPWTGRLTDRIGPRRSVIIVLAISAIGMGAMSVANSVWALAAASMVGGIPQGWGNPATNSLIAALVDPGRRGSVTGIKQSGVTVGIFLAGATLPALATTWGWRTAIGVYAVVFVVMTVAAALTLAPDPPARSSAAANGTDRDSPIPPLIGRLTWYSLLMGITAGGVGRFFNLFAEEAIGVSIHTAGLLTALGGLLGIGARILAGRAAEHRVAPTDLLAAFGVAGALYCGLLAITTPSTAGLLWLSPGLNAIGIAAWNAVAMLAIIMYVPREAAGRASGTVVLGFLAGLTVGGPLAGLGVDLLGSYRPVWLAGALLALIAAAIAAMSRATATTRDTR